ncbi:MAG: prephenate dehydratase domain-containing protein [Candidatus Dojkabacteria bacterium]|nr:MAG: prephenate dehydratase domain-containing protein [Candidatus Dojkabacteria bacterium]
MKIGIQGGEGSFNHSAALKYISENGIKNAKIEYLYTSERVLAALEAGEVDLGLFAIFNTLGGVVEESAEAIGKHDFQYVDTLSLQIRHFLMCSHECSAADLKTIYAHPQVFIQCALTLGKRYASVELRSGDGEMIDTARAAQALASGELDKHCAILGNKDMAEIYGLKIVDEDLQDREDNNTHFLIVRPLKQLKA